MGVSMNDIMFQIQDKIKSNPDILKLLYYMDNTKNPLEQPPLTRVQAEEITKNNIYTRKKIPKENETISSYVSMEYGQKFYHHQDNKFLNGNTFFFYVLCHADIDTNHIIGSRICEIERCISEMFDNGSIGTVCNTVVSESRNIGVGDYIGREIKMVFMDKNSHMLNKVVGR